MPYLYTCPECRTESDPYRTEIGARGHGDDHRKEFHGGDRPYGEAIVPVERPQLTRSDIRILAIVALLLLAGLLGKLL